MLNFNVGSVLLLLVLGVAVMKAALAQSSESTVPQWGEYKARFTKTYTSSAEEIKRKAIYESNKKMVEEWNANPANTFKLGMNQFSDETTEEVRAKRTGLKEDDTQFSYLLTKSGNALTALSIDPYPEKLNYVGTRMVSAVKDQGSCGSGYAFAVSQAVEAQAVKAFNRVIMPSEQELIDCDTSNSGCDGGLTSVAYKYMNNGIQNSSTYPFESGSSGQTNTCSANSALSVVSTSQYYIVPIAVKFGWDYGSHVLVPDEGFGDLNASFYNKTIGALNEIGPLSVYVCSNSLFRLYSSGVFNNNETRCTDADRNHLVLLVGYDRSSSNQNEHYWTVKNSWNALWGEQGYMKIKMGAGLIRSPMYPILNTDSITDTTTMETTEETTEPTTTSKDTTPKKTTTTTKKTTTKQITTAKKTTPKKTTPKKTTSRKSTTKTTTKTTTKKTTPKKTTSKKTTTKKTTPKKTTTKKTITTRK